MNSNVKSKVEDFLGEKIKSANSVSGGCIADSRVLQTESGKQYFLKTHSGTPGMFLKEGNSLKELAKPGSDWSILRGYIPVCKEYCTKIQAKLPKVRLGSVVNY